MAHPEPYEIGGRRLKCPHCGNGTFYTRQTQLNTAGMEFLDLAWLNRTAQNYICSQCGRIEWFLDEAGPGQTISLDSIECLSCHATIPAGKTRCPACGWTYEEPAPEVT